MSVSSVGRSMHRLVDRSRLASVWGHLKAIKIKPYTYQ